MQSLSRRFGNPVLFALVSAFVFSPVRADEPGRDSKGENPALQAAAALYDGIRTETLPNGMRVYLKPVPGSPVVTTMVAYKVGSADEDLDHTGLSHYLEHLMFKGTEKIRPGDIDRLTLRNGGANNAYTSEDFTVYHFDFAADRWQAGLKIEADRMQNLRIDAAHEFEQEKGAVVAELERDEDEPWDIETKTILPLLFGDAPYGHPTIGERAHVRGATAAVIKAHYDKWYHPNNAALVICGGFDPDQTLAQIKELFGPIPRVDLPARKTATSIKREAPVHKEIASKFDVPRMLMGFNGVRSGDPDFYPLQVIQGLLTSGKTGRLYRKLVEGEEVASAVDCTNNAGRYLGWIEIQLELLQGKDPDKAEQTVLAELRALRDQPVSEAELKRIKRRLLAGTIFSRESVHALADSIARGVTTNDVEFLKTYLPRLQAVTAQDVQAVARKYFDPQQRVVVWSVPRTPPRQESRIEDRGSRTEKQESRIEDRGSRTEKEGSLSSILHPLSSKAKARSSKAPPAGGASSFSLKEARRVELPNGLTLLLFEDHRLPIVVADALLRRAHVYEPEDKSGVAALVGNLLDEGTAQHSGPQIAELIENVGGSLSVSSAGGTVKVLSPDRDLGLGILFECLLQANFPQNAFAREKAQQLSAIADAEHQPDAKAHMVYRRLAYGKHPLGRPTLGRRDTVQGLTPDDCRRFYHEVFVPENAMVAIVGSFDSKQVIEEVTRLTADWKKSPLPKLELPAVEQPKEFKTEIVTMPEAAQLHFFMGQPGIRRNNPDYFKLLVMDYVLGTGPGFTDRLSARLRDRQGLGYTVSASITSTAGEEPGLFTCYIGTSPQFFGRVKELFLEEVERLRNEKPTDEEVEDVKKYLTGNLPFHLTTTERIAGQLLTIERYHLGLNYLDDYRKAVMAVSPEDVQVVARNYLDPKHMILVAAGALDQTGKPLERLGPPKGPE
jgi:zinc protease